MSATKAGVEIDIRYDKESLGVLTKQSPDLSSQLSAIFITDQKTVDRANELIRAGKQWCDAIDRILDPVREASHAAWKASIKAQDELKSPVLRPLAMLKVAVTKFVLDAQEAARRKQEAADAEQRRINEAEARRVAGELKALGASKVEIKEAREEIKAVAAPIVAPIAETSAGQSVRILYSAKVTNCPEFIKHLAADPFLLTLFSYSESFKKAIESELRGEATKRKDSYSIPGTELVKTASGAWRG